MLPQMQDRKPARTTTNSSAQKFVFRVLCTSVLILCNYARSKSGLMHAPLMEQIQTAPKTSRAGRKAHLLKRTGSTGTGGNARTRRYMRKSGPGGIHMNMGTELCLSILQKLHHRNGTSELHTYLAIHPRSLVSVQLFWSREIHVNILCSDDRFVLLSWIDIF
jgi:hypothetical protein